MRFDVKVIDSTNSVLVVSYNAESEKHARAQADSQGFAVLSVNPIKSSLRLGTIFSANLFSLQLFTEELLALIKAGLNIVEALSTLVEKETKIENKKILQDILQCIHEGSSVSEAFAKFPSIFPALYVATIKTSEQTGDVI
ncbi:MAG: type II secretion system F family protein, partial [Gammaproteobacteria bacterium]|nr:type II secretion system F family protein [Gammaproteobacteria bacterium]